MSCEPAAMNWPFRRQVAKYRMKAWQFPAARALLTASGRWDKEPDKLQMIDPVTDLDCLAVRGHATGAWCGYVGAPPGHPWHGMDYGDVPADAHGGLTFSGLCADHGGEEYAVCHTPEPGRPHAVWWLGFDCGHSMDVCPAFLNLPGYADLVLRWPDTTYKPLGYVLTETLVLAAQVHRAG